MSERTLGVAVIGAGMAGKAHAAGYRSATAVYGSGLPPVRLVSIADTYEPLAADTARRFGFERYDTSWQAIAAADDIDVVSVVVANALHREIVGHCWPWASMCCARSRCRRASATPARWSPPPHPPTRSPASA